MAIVINPLSPFNPAPPQGSDTPASKLTSTDTKVQSVIKAPLVTTGVTSSVDVVSDERWFFGLGPEKLSDFLKFKWLWTAVPSSIPASVEIQAMGLQSAMNIPQGIIGSIRAKNDYDQASTLGDGAAKIEAGVNVLRGGVQSAGGASFLSLRCTSIVGLMQKAAGVHSVAALGAATAGLGFASCGLFGLFFLLIGGSSVYKLKQEISFKNALRKAKESGEIGEFAFLKAQLARNSKDEWVYLSPDPDARQKLKQEGQAFIGNTQLEHMSELKKHNEYSSHYQTFLNLTGYNEMQIGQHLDPCEVIGFNLRETKRKQILENRLAGLTSAECVEKVKILADRELKGEKIIPAELSELSDKVKKASDKNLYLHIILVALAAIGTISMVFMMISPVGWVMTAVMISSVLLIGVMLAVDSHFAKNGLEAKGPIGTYDKTYLKAAMALNVGSLILATILVLITTTTVAAAFAYLGPAIVIVLLAAFIYGGALGKLNAREKLWNAEQEALRTQEVRKIQEEALRAKEKEEALAAQALAAQKVQELNPKEAQDQPRDEIQRANDSQETETQTVRSWVVSGVVDLATVALGCVAFVYFGLLNTMGSSKGSS